MVLEPKAEVMIVIRTLLGFVLMLVAFGCEMPTVLAPFKSLVLGI